MVTLPSLAIHVALLAVSLILLWRFAKARGDATAFRRAAAERTAELERELEAHARSATALALERERFQADLAAAAAIQRSLLPAHDLDLPGLRAAWRFRPCETVGGDLFNVFALNDNFTAFYCLDVSGHGVQAALTSVALSRLLSTWGADASLMVTPSGRIRWPREVVEILNQRFFGDAEERQFFTIVYGLVNRSTQTLSYVRAGHPLPLLVPPGAPPEFLRGGDVPVGFTGTATFSEIHRPFPRGTRLYVYSDGITEALRPGDRERFGTSRFAAAVCASDAGSAGPPRSLDGSLDDLFRDLEAFQGNDRPHDDISLLALEML